MLLNTGRKNIITWDPLTLKTFFFFLLDLSISLEKSEREENKYIKRIPIARERDAVMGGRPATVRSRTCGLAFVLVNSPLLWGWHNLASSKFNLLYIPELIHLRYIFLTLSNITNMHIKPKQSLNL